MTRRKVLATVLAIAIIAIVATLYLYGPLKAMLKLPWNGGGGIQIVKTSVRKLFGHLRPKGAYAIAVPTNRLYVINLTGEPKGPVVGFGSNVPIGKKTLVYVVKPREVDGVTLEGACGAIFFGWLIPKPSVLYTNVTLVINATYIPQVNRDVWYIVVNGTWSRYIVVEPNSTDHDYIIHIGPLKVDVFAHSFCFYRNGAPVGVDYALLTHANINKNAIFMFKTLS